jgi:hypothetical protein
MTPNQQEAVRKVLAKYWSYSVPAYIDEALQEIEQMLGGDSKVLLALKNLITVQANCYQDSDYMAGLMNGLLLAESLFGGEYHPVESPKEKYKLQSDLARALEAIRPFAGWDKYEYSHADFDKAKQLYEELTKEGLGI